jgi:hypothetical protein
VYRIIFTIIDLTPQAARGSSGLENPNRHGHFWWAMSTKHVTEDIPEIEVTSAMIDAGRDAMEPYAFTSMDGYELEPALAAAFKAMVREYRKKEHHQIA